MTTYKCANEKDVKRHVRKLLDQHNWFWWMPPANAYGKSGISDFHALRDGVFMVIETKFGKNKPTEPQKGFLGSVASMDGFAFVVNDTTLDHFSAWLHAFDRSVEAAQKNEMPAQEDGAEMVNMIRTLTQEY